jgi:hypothetical protein
VLVFVLLNIILYCGNNLCRYLVDLDAMSFVSWMAIRMVEWVCLLMIVFLVMRYLVYHSSMLLF